MRIRVLMDKQRVVQIGVAQRSWRSRSFAIIV